jgi:hypothetical protein
VACRNPQLARLRALKREALLLATQKNLQAIQNRVEAGRLKKADAIGLAAGKVVNQYKVAKHFELAIGDTSFTFGRKHEAIATEAALDGIYVIRTSVHATRLDSADCVRNYKALANVERASHHAQRKTTARARSDPADPAVGRRRNPRVTPSACGTRTNSSTASRTSA